MKKSLLLILGAAMLFAGCAKDLTSDLDNLTSRVDQIEKQVESNKKAIEALQKANFISKVEQTATGWSVTLSDGSVLALYNGAAGADGKPGADGKDGDAFFESVEVKDGMVIFTLTDGTTFEVPLMQEFAISLDSREIAVEPDTEVKIPFTIVGKTAETEVYVLASGAYEARIKGDAVIVKIPSVITNDAVLLAADNGHGKTSIKSLNFEKHAFEVGEYNGVAYFWGSEAKFKVTSNVAYSVTTSVPWIEVVSTKAVVDNTVTVKVLPSPCAYTRTGEVYVRDAFDNVVQTVKIAQGGTSPVMVFNTGYKTIAEAIAGVADNADVKTNGYVDIAISEAQAPIEEIIAIPESDMKWVVRVRSIGGGKAENCVVRGIDVRNTELEVKDITIEPAVAFKGNRPLAKEGDKYGIGYFSHPYGLCVEQDASKPITVKNVIFKVSDELVAYGAATLLYVCPSTGLVTLDGCQIDGRGSRISQIYGGNVKFNACRIANGYSSYAVRVGDANAHLLMTNNTIDTPKVVDIYSTIAATSTITLGENGVDNNRYSEKVTVKAVDPQKEGVTVTIGKAVEAGTVALNGAFTYATVQEAIDAAKAGDVITIGEQEYAENVKINKNVTIQGKNRETSIIAGNMEIASGVTVKNLTVKEKAGVTNADLKYAGGSYAWGHKFLFRVENGASGVLLENANVIADDNDATADFMNSVSTIWISQAWDVTIRNCKIVTTADGAYCPNQTYDSRNVVFEGNEFVGGGKKEWSIRVAAASDVIIRNNTFHSKYAIDVLNTFKGVLTLGDGKTDNNIYASEVEVALNGDKEARLEAGAMFFPTEVVFGRKETVVIEPVWEKLWSANIDALGINDSRGFTMWNGEVLCGVAAGDKGEGSPAPYVSSYPMVTVANGAVSKTLATLTEGAGFTGWVTGVTVVENAGKQDLIACGVVATGNKWAATNYDFYVYHFTSPDEYEIALKWTMPEAEAERAGDYLSFRGTWQDGEILICAANGNGLIGKYVYSFAVKDGVAAKEPVKIALDDEIQNKKSGAAGIYHYKGDQYIITSEGLAPVVVKREADKFSYVATMDMTNFVAEDKTAKVIRTPQFVTIRGKEYMIFLHTNYASSNSNGGWVCVLPVKNENLAESLQKVEASDIKMMQIPISAAPAGNGFAGLGVEKDGYGCNIGYGLRHGEIGVIKFIP